MTQQRPAQRPPIVLIGSYLVALVMDVARLPHTGETVLARNFRETYGGKGSDMAVQAARLGAAVEFIGCVGQDSYGEDFLQLMEREGVSTRFVQQSAELPTGAGFIIKSVDGANIITIDIGANQLFGPSLVDQALPLLEPQSVMLIQCEIPLETALYAAQRGRERGDTVILNPAPAYPLQQYDLSTVDILTPNETEARVCLGLAPDDPSDDLVIGRRLLQLGCRSVLMTLGERGCLLVTPHETVHLPAPGLPAILDTNGAGDAFNAALATALNEGQPLISAAHFANAVAGLCCTRGDTVPSYHTRAEVDAFFAHSKSV